MIAPLYIEVKNTSDILVSSKWDDDNSDVEIGS